MYCMNCGAEIEDGYKFCMECGAAVGYEDTAASTYAPQYKEKTSTYRYDQPQSSSFSLLKLVGIIGGVFLAVIVLVLIIAVISDDQPSDSIVSTSEDTYSLAATTPSETIPLELDSEYIARAKEVALLEYGKYIDVQDMREFMRLAYDNDISLDMLYRRPTYYEGKEVYFGGTVVQTIYSPDAPLDVELRLMVTGAESPNNTVYVSYTLNSSDARLLEDDYIDMYGVFKGMLTYETVRGDDVTVPYVEAKKIYCNADNENTALTPLMKDLLRRVDGDFVSESGETFSFGKLKNSEDNIFTDPTNYMDCIVAYFTPYEGWDINNPPPFYRVTAFKDGTIVVFEPSETAEAGIYAIEEGIYSEYSPITSKDTAPTQKTTATTPPATRATEPPATAAPVLLNINGYVIESSGGLNIRSGPSITYDKIGRLEPLSKVTILEIQSDGSMNWGRIGQGWVSMDYIVYGDPPEPTNAVPRNIINQYTGHWGDIVSQRCMMQVNYHDGLFTFELKWGNSASSTAHWQLTGKYDAASNSVIYTDGRHYTTETLEPGITTDTQHYYNGYGSFYIGSDGYMYWNDQLENRGANCIFEKS